MLISFENLVISEKMDMPITGISFALHVGKCNSFQNYSTYSYVCGRSEFSSLGECVSDGFVSGYLQNNGTLKYRPPGYGTDTTYTFYRYWHISFLQDRIDEGSYYKDALLFNRVFQDKSTCEAFLKKIKNGEIADPEFLDMERTPVTMECRMAQSGKKTVLLFKGRRLSSRMNFYVCGCCFKKGS